MSASGSSSEKPPRIKGLVKRCRLFKEDILSRLARTNRNREEHGSYSPGGYSHSGGTSPIPGETSSDPLVIVSHRLKEAYLTLQFVESLIRKSCVDLLGGSSNVMLDLMGNLLNDIKRAPASDSVAYQSAISQIKSTLSDFLTAVDALLLKDRCCTNGVGDSGGDQAQRELYFEKLLDTLKSTREALTRLKNLIETKENGHDRSRTDSGIGIPSVSSSCSRKPVSPSKSDSGASPYSQMSSPSSSSPATTTATIELEEKKPPLPPKLRQWSAKSFDMEWPTSSSPSPSSPHHHPHYHHHNRSFHHHHRTSQEQFNKSLLMESSEPGTRDLLSQWLEQSSLNTSTQQRTQHHQQQQQNYQSGNNWESSQQQQQQQYVARSSSSSLSHSKIMSSASNLNNSIVKNRTYSDSYRIEDSQESLDKMILPEYSDCHSEAKSGTTHNSHNSQSLSLGSSLDNLLLVDSQSQQSGLSPNNSGANRVSVSSSGSRSDGRRLSNNTHHGGVLAGLANYDPEDADNVFVTENEEQSPPELPEKSSCVRTRRHFLLGVAANAQRCPSPYDNVDEADLATWHCENSNGNNDNGGYYNNREHFQQSRQFMSYSESRNTLTDEEKPPLPPKKKHSLITAYMELMHNFDSYSQYQHHQQLQNHRNQFQHHSHVFQDQPQRPYLQERSATLYNPSTGGLPGIIHTSGSGSNTPNSISGNICDQFTSYHHPPANFARSSYSSSYHHFSFYGGGSQISGVTSPTSPTSVDDRQILLTPQSPTNTSQQGFNSFPNSRSSSLNLRHDDSLQQPPALPPKRSRQFQTHLSCKSEEEEEEVEVIGAFSDRKSSIGSPNVVNNPESLGNVPTSPVLNFSTAVETPGGCDEESPELYSCDVSSMLIFNETTTTTNNNNTKAVTETPEVKGGEPHLLLIYAATPELKDVKFRQVFLLTYRNFIQPFPALSLMWKRYQYFEKKNDRSSNLHARATLDLFVDTVSTLTPMDMDQEMVTKLRNCIYHLVNSGEVLSALKARKGLIFKYETRIKLLKPKPPPASLAVTAEPQNLLQWTATSIAQQMTMLDAELFRLLEPAELLIWAREQSEELCPALNNFTEHFNKVSYWARSKVLLCANSRERNRTMKKLIEVMRKLREYNNFNSLLAVLAALDSAPIRRLGFSKRLTETLKPHAALTDSSGSFRNYRIALSESKPPCIPYIGLVLQDLTFVHIGNADLLPDGKVSWIKRWQQWVVLDPVRRFHACNYGFSKCDALLLFLNNFDESLNDDDLWQLSEQIKPRGKNPS